MKRLWGMVKDESNGVIAVATSLTCIIALAMCIVAFLDHATKQDEREYIAEIRKGEGKIDLGNGEYIGYKLLVDDSKTLYEINRYWRKNTEPSQITKDNAERISSIAIPNNAQNQEIFKNLF